VGFLSAAAASERRFGRKMERRMDAAATDALQRALFYRRLDKPSWLK